MLSRHIVRAIFVLVVVSLSFIEIPGVMAQQPVSTTLCAVMGKPSAFAGRIVKLRATVRSGFEISTIFDANQPACEEPWFEYAAEAGSENWQDDYDAFPQRRHPVVLVKDENMKSFDDYLGAVVYPRTDKIRFLGGNPRRYRVTATMTGRVDDAGEHGSRFGHLNGWRVRIVLSAVEDVTTEEISYNWAEFSRDPVRFPQGTISGRLTDSGGRPIKFVWVGAIPTQGKVPVAYPEDLTKEDGSYSLKVEPGKYFIVANPRYPASGDAPLLTTYFPSSETEGGATALEIVDYDDLVGVDIQTHRVLIPRFFDVQVLAADGKTASGLYSYLTQTDRAPMVDQAGVTHTDSDGRTRLSGFEGIDYFLWASRGSGASETCAPVVRLDHNHVYSGPIVVTISLTSQACDEQENDARSKAYASQLR